MSVHCAVSVCEREKDGGRIYGHTQMLHRRAHPVNSLVVPYPLNSYSSAGLLSSKIQRGRQQLAKEKQSIIKNIIDTQRKQTHGDTCGS